MVSVPVPVPIVLFFFLRLLRCFLEIFGLSELPTCSDASGGPSRFNNETLACLVAALCCPDTRGREGESPNRCMYGVIELFRAGTARPTRDGKGQTVPYRLKPTYWLHLRKYHRCLECKFEQPWMNWENPIVVVSIQELHSSSSSSPELPVFCLLMANPRVFIIR